MDIEKMKKINADLTTRIDNMVGVLRDLTSRLGTSQKHNNELLNLMLKGKTLANDKTDLAWNMTPEKRIEIVQMFLLLLSSKRNEREPKGMKRIFSESYDEILQELNFMVVPLFDKIKNKHHLDLVNSWVTEDIRDKFSSFSQVIDHEEEGHGNLVQISQTPQLNVIDINPMCDEEWEKIKKVAETSSPDPSVSILDHKGILCTKQFLNIQFPQQGDVEKVIDKGLKESWETAIKTELCLGLSSYTITGQKIEPCASQQSYEKYIIPFLIFLLGGRDNYIYDTEMFLNKIESKKQMENGTQNMNTYFFNEILFDFWKEQIDEE